MVSPGINPERAYEEMYYNAGKHLPSNPVLDQKTALVYAVFAVATGLFAVSAAITKLAEAYIKNAAKK